MNVLGVAGLQAAELKAGYIMLLVGAAVVSAYLFKKKSKWGTWATVVSP